MPHRSSPVRWDALVRAVGAWLAAAASPALAAAQRPYDAAEGFLVREAVSVEAAHATCLTGLRIGPVAPADVLPCRVTEVATMDTAGAWRWTMVRYRRGAVERFDGDVDTVDLDELVLLAVDRDRDLAIPVWHVIRDRAIELIDGVRWARKPSGLLVAVTLCLNGTGGCYQEFLTEYGGDHWAVVEQTYLVELARRAPAGFTLHKGRRLDLETMAGEQPIATRDDANCCPSGLMRFSVWLDGRRLRLVAAEVVVKPERQREPGSAAASIPSVRGTPKLRPQARRASGTAPRPLGRQPARTTGTALRPPTPRDSSGRPFQTTARGSP